MTLTPPQAEALFTVLVNDLDIDPQGHDTFVHACVQGADAIQVNGFTKKPKYKQPRLILPGDPRRLRCHTTDATKLAPQEHRLLRETRARLGEILDAPPLLRYDLPLRARVSALAA